MCGKQNIHRKINACIFDWKGKINFRNLYYPELSEVSNHMLWNSRASCWCYWRYAKLAGRLLMALMIKSNFSSSRAFKERSQSSYIGPFRLLHYLLIVFKFICKESLATLQFLSDTTFLYQLVPFENFGKISNTSIRLINFGLTKTLLTDEQHTFSSAFNKLASPDFLFSVLGFSLTTIVN